MDESEEKQMNLMSKLFWKGPIWDPPPPWLRLDEKMIRQFAQMEIRFQLKELELQQQKMQEFGKLLGAG